MSDELRIDIAGNAKAEAGGIEQQLAKVEERAEASREVLRDLQRELRNAKARAADLAEAYKELGDETLRGVAKSAYEEAREEAEGLAASVAHVRGEQRSAKAEADRLKDSIKATATEAKRLEREGAQAAAKALLDAKKEATDLQKQLEARRAKEMADEVKRAAHEASELRKNFADVNSLAGRVGRSMQDAAVNALQEFIRSIPEGSAAAERHQTVIRNLGSAYQEVQRQTRGVVSAEQAYRVQQRLSESGLELSGEQLGVVTRRAREYAQTVGVDLQQALDQLTEGMTNGANEQLRKFGVVVQTGSTRAQTFTSTLRQLEQQQRGNAPAALSAAESQQQFQTALNDATQAAQGFIAQQFGLTEFLTGATSLFRDMADGTKDWADALDAVLGTLGEIVHMGGFAGRVDQAINGFAASHPGVAHALGLQNNVEPVRGTSTPQAFMAQYVAAQRELRALGGDADGLPAAGPLAERTNARERQQILDAINGRVRELQTRSSAATALAAQGMFGRTDLNGVTDLSQGVQSGLLAEVGAVEREASDRAAADDLARRKAEARRRDGNRRTGSREAAAQLPPVDPDALAQALGDLARLQNQVMRAGGRVGAEVNGARYVDTAPEARLDELQKRADDTTRRAHETELAYLQRRSQATQAYLQALHEQETVLDRVRQKDREAEGFEAVRRANALHAADERREHEQEALRQRIDLVGARQQEIESNNALVASYRTLTGTEQGVDAQRAERIQQLTTLRTAMQDLLAETDLRITQARAEGRSQAEINELLQERIGLQRSISQTAQEQTQIQHEQHASTIAYRDAMVGTLTQTADAFAASSISALESGKSWGDAMQEMLRGTLFALAKQSIVETLKATAIGFVALAQGNFVSATNAFTGAGIWAATGLAAGAVATAIPKPQTQGAPTAASAPAPRAAQLGPSERSGQSGGLTLNISVSGAMFNEGVEDGIVRAIDSAARRGMIPRVIRHATA